MGLTPETFWSLTPAQFFTFINRKEHLQDVIDYRYGIVASTVANCHRGKKRAFTAEDFMPNGDEIKQKRKVHKKIMTPQQIRHQVMQINAKLGGTVTRGN